MSGQDRQEQLLTVGQVAQRCGVSVDTVRAWARSGRLPALRTAGGQRRFREADVGTLTCATKAPPRAPAHSGAPPASRPRVQRARPFAPTNRAQDWVEGDPMVIEARTQLEVARAEAERDTLDRQLRADARLVEREQEAEQRRQAEVSRLEGLKAYGRSIGADLPVGWFSTLTSDLEQFVTASNLPASLPSEQAETLIANRVARVRDQFRAEQSEQLGAMLDSMKLRSLIEVGRRLATSRTMLWDLREAEIARSLVNRELAAQVEVGWVEADVRALVEDVLSEWEDDGADDPEDDEDMPEEGDWPEEDDADFG